MCCQQSTTANKLCYLETWLADVELWHQSRWNQVIEFSCLSFSTTNKRKTNWNFACFPNSVKTDMLPSGAISRLYIANANRHDSGNYSCGEFNDSSIRCSVAEFNFHLGDFFFGKFEVKLREVRFSIEMYRVFDCSKYLSVCWNHWGDRM
jgi:hypothetical protein